ncbi:hypothetical protein EIP86_010574 [Pleurotus ostreatoroseus]|nr:hypothetical protein EIP86_010574 [Pleurotus ostreatoroseus]
MSQWKDAFSKGIASFRGQQYEQALASFSEAISLGSNEASVYDSRAAVYEKLGKRKEALLDSKQVIYLAPDLWKGYARSARLFHSARKYDSALKMVNMALERIKPEDTRRVADFQKLRQDIISAGEADAELQRRKARETAYHFGNMPLELAMTVFQLALQDNPAHVVVLAQVCRQWRSVICGTPALWDTLVLTSRKPSRKAKVWKERSQGHLRRLDLRDGDMKIIWALSEFDTTPLHRLRELSLRKVRVDHFFQILPTCTSRVLHNLEYLELDELVRAKDSLRFTQEAGPALRHLIARNTPVHWSTLADTCQHLQTLVYSGDNTTHPSLDDFLWFLHRNPLLETLDVRFFETVPEPNSAELSEPAIPRVLPPRLTMPSLTKLVLSGLIRGMMHFHNLASSHLPSLQILHLVQIARPIESLLDALFAGSPAPGLTEVKIDLSVIRSPDTLPKLLDYVPNLQVVTIAHVCFVNGFAEALATPIEATNEGGTQVRCPKLRHLEIINCPDVKTGPIVRIVKMRNAQVPQPEAGSRPFAKISTLNLDQCLIEPEVIPWLRQQVPVMSCVYQTKNQARWRR